MGYRVKGTPVAVSLGPDGGTQVVQFIDAGGTLPPDVADVQVKHLLTMGLIEAVSTVPEPDLEPAGDTVPEPVAPAPRKGRTPPRGKAAAPAEGGKELADLTVDQLRAEAAARGIEVPEGVTDPADLVAILEQ